MFRLYYSLIIFASISGIKSSKLLLLKQRSRLDSLFTYEISECVKLATPVNPQMFSTPYMNEDLTLSSIRAVITNLAFANTPRELVDIVRSLNIAQSLPWTIEYECQSPLEYKEETYQISKNLGNRNKFDNKKEFIPSSASLRKSFSSKTLFLSLAQCIQGTYSFISDVS